MLDELADLIVIQTRPRTQLTWVDLERLKNISFVPPAHAKTQKAVDDLLKCTA